MEIIHVSAECYPVAKAGGLGDVVGALPKYQNKAGHFAKVVMPMYKTKFLYDNDWSVDFKGYANMGSWVFEYTIIKETTNKLGFDLYLIDIHGLLDRDGIYGFDDDTERFTAFQIAFANWLSHWEHQPDVVHCHDHHTALIPFMLQYSYPYRFMSHIPTVVTIHNAQYQGWMGWNKSHYLPMYDEWKGGMLEWDNTINPLASGVKCASAVTTVSWSYLDELRWNSNGLEALFEYERGKCRGILNGIDYEVWNPATDPFLKLKYSTRNISKGKSENKKFVCDEFGLDATKPLVVFIGRLVGEKAADILPDAIAAALYASNHECCFMILGSGDPHVEGRLNEMKNHFGDKYNVYIGYHEGLSHQLYAAADFLLMPSRVEPCGLNQMYALRYGTVPMVRSTGGLIDTVTDIGDGGFGLRFNHATVHDIVYTVQRAVELYKSKNAMLKIRKDMMKVDHSWEGAVQQYLDLYSSLK